MVQVAKPAVRRMDFQGLDLRIEYPKGSQRSYEDDKGNTQYKRMYADYGEVRHTKGLDGDAVDVYVGPDKTSDRVFVVTQMKKNDWEKVDEEKCILGVQSKKDARALYLKHYNDDRFCGAIKELSMDDFQDRLETKGSVGKKIASAGARIAELNYLRMQQGLPVLVDHGVKVANEDYAEYPQQKEELSARRVGKAVGKAAISPLGVGIATGGVTSHLTKNLPTPARAGVSALSAIGAHQMAKGLHNQVKKHKGRYDKGRAVEEYEKNASIPWSPELDRARDEQRKFASIDPNWGEDISDEAERLLKKKAPERYETIRRASVGETEVTQDEQLGIGVKKNEVKKDPTDSKMRKAAQIALIDGFLKEAKMSPDKRRENQRAALGGTVGGTLGAIGGAAAGGRLIRHGVDVGGKRIISSPSLIGTYGGAVLGALGGGYAGKEIGKGYHKHTKTQAQKSEKRKWLERGATAAGVAAGAWGLRHGAKKLIPHFTGKAPKAEALEPLTKQVGRLGKAVKKFEHIPDVKKGLETELASAKAVHRITDKTPASTFGREASKGELRGAALGGGVGGGAATIGGLKTVDHFQGRKKERKKKAALSERASTIADRIDDVGIGILASPYLAEGIAKRTMNKRGITGMVGKSLHAYHEAFPKKNRKEVAGLALVAPGITHTIAKGVDKGIDRAQKNKLSSVASQAVSTVGGLAKRLIPGASRAAGSLAQAAEPAVAKAMTAPVTSAAQQALPRGSKLIGGMVNPQAAQAVARPAAARGPVGQMVAGRQQAIADATRVAPATMAPPAPLRSMGPGSRQAQGQALQSLQTVPPPAAQSGVVPANRAGNTMAYGAARPTPGAQVPTGPVNRTIQATPMPNQPSRALAQTAPPPPINLNDPTFPPPPRVPSQISAAEGAAAPIRRNVSSPTSFAGTIAAPPPPGSFTPSMVPSLNPPAYSQSGIRSVAPRPVTAPPPAQAAAAAAPTPAAAAQAAPAATGAAPAPAVAGAPTPAPAAASATPAAAASVPPPAASATTPAPAPAPTGVAGGPAAAATPAGTVTVNGRRVVADQNGMPIVDAKGNYIDPELTTGQKVWQGAKGFGKGVRNTAILGLGAAGLGVGTAGLAAANVIGAAGHGGGYVPPGYVPPSQ